MPAVPAAIDVNPLLQLRDAGWFDKLGLRVDYRLEESFRASRPAAVSR